MLRLRAPRDKALPEPARTCRHGAGPCELSCGVSCRRSCVVHTLAAADSGTSRLASPQTSGAALTFHSRRPGKSAGRIHQMARIPHPPRQDPRSETIPVNSNNATLTGLATAQTGSTVKDSAPNAPAAGTFDLVLGAVADSALGSSGAPYTLTISAIDLTAATQGWPTQTLHQAFDTVNGWTLSGTGSDYQCTQTFAVPVPGGGPGEAAAVGRAGDPGRHHRPVRRHHPHHPGGAPHHPLAPGAGPGHRRHPRHRGPPAPPASQARRPPNGWPLVRPARCPAPPLSGPRPPTTPLIRQHRRSS